MSTRSLPSHDLKLIDDRRLVYEAPLTLAGLHAASFRTEDGMGVVVAAQLAALTGIPSARADANMEHLQRLGLVRIERRWDPDRGDPVRVDLRPIVWSEEHRRLRAQKEGQGHGGGDDQ